MLDVRSLWDWCRDALGRGRPALRLVWGDRTDDDSAAG